MTTTNKMAAGAAFPAMQFDSIGGEQMNPAGQSGWRALVVYRGKHCPICKKYLETLNQMLPEFQAANVAVSTVSADPREKAEAQVAEGDLKFPVGYGMTIDQMRQLGLYVSDPRSAQETDRPFSEPGLFVINPDGEVQIVDISNAPFSRPDLASVLKGVQFVMSKDYPIRGRA